MRRDLPKFKRWVRVHKLHLWNDKCLKSLVFGRVVRPRVYYEEGSAFEGYVCPVSV